MEFLVVAMLLLLVIGGFFRANRSSEPSRQPEPAKKPVVRKNDRDNLRAVVKRMKSPTNVVLACLATLLVILIVFLRPDR